MKYRFGFLVFTVCAFVLSLSVLSCSDSTRGNAASQTAQVAENGVSFDGHFRTAKNLFVIATADECAHVVKHFGLKRVCKGFYADGSRIAAVFTDIGGAKVNAALARVRISGNVVVVNVGYCGSNVLKKGDVVRVGSVAKIESPSIKMPFKGEGVECYSADAFVTETDIKTPCVFDMELAYIKRIFPNVVSYKIVSDNLRHEEYENFKGEESWSNFFETVSAELEK